MGFRILRAQDETSHKDAVRRHVTAKIYLRYGYKLGRFRKRPVVDYRNNVITKRNKILFMSSLAKKIDAITNKAASIRVVISGLYKKLISIPV